MTYFVILTLCALILMNVPIGFALMVTALLAMSLQGIDLIMVPIQLFSGTNSVILMAIPMFIFMGEIMGSTSISARIIALASSLVGAIRGGLAHVNVLTSMFMAEMSGSAVADAAVMSKIFVPQMEKKGYPASFAAAVTATSATLGIIIPPSIPMILYGVATNTSIKDLFLAGIIPGILLGGAFMITSYIFALKNNYPPDEPFTIRNVGHSLSRAWVPLFIPVFVVGGLIYGIVTPTEAAVVGVVTALAYGVGRRDLNLPKIYDLIVTTVRQTSTVMMIIGGSAILGQFFANEQIPQKIATAMTTVSDNPYIMLFMINIFLLFLGMFLHASAAIIIVIPMLLPLAQKIGIDPVHFGIITCLNLGIGQQTPPVASVMLTVCSTTGQKIGSVMGYAKWYILTMFIVLMIVSYTPLIMK